MKKACKDIIRFIGFVSSFLFPYKLYTGIKLITNLIYSGYIKRQFRSVGQNYSFARSTNIIGGQYIVIGNNFTALSGLWIDAYSKFENYTYNPSIIIGDNVIINVDCHIGCINKIVIGNDVLIASKVYITDHFHGDSLLSILPPRQRPLVSKGEVVIGDNVWIGEGVVIMPNVKIGKNSIIGANAVVTKSFDENSVITGVPARLLKTL